MINRIYLLWEMKSLIMRAEWGESGERGGRQRCLAHAGHPVMQLLTRGLDLRDLELILG